MQYLFTWSNYKNKIVMLLVAIVLLNTETAMLVN